MRNGLALVPPGAGSMRVSVRETITETNEVEELCLTRDVEQLEATRRAHFPPFLITVVLRFMNSARRQLPCGRTGIQFFLSLS